MISEDRLQRLDLQCEKTLRNVYRPNTARNYRSRANIYLRFCHFYKIKAFPVQEWDMVRYARYLANGLTCYDSLAGYVSTIKRLHELGGYQFPEHTHILKAQMLALKREMAAPVKKAPPVTPVILSQIHAHVNFASGLQTACYAALVVGFCLFLRRSNLVPETVKGFNAAEQLVRGDVWTYTWLTMIDIKWSKTEQFKPQNTTFTTHPCKKRKNLWCALDKQASQGCEG